jgi:hypothetical protein
MKKFPQEEGFEASVEVIRSKLAKKIRMSSSKTFLSTSRKVTRGMVIYK